MIHIAAPHTAKHASATRKVYPTMSPKRMRVTARIGIANVLEKKINSGEYNQATAEFVARRVMHENAEDFYQM